MSKDPFHPSFRTHQVNETIEKVPNLLSMQVVKMTTIQTQKMPRTSNSRTSTPIIRYVRRLPSEMTLADEKEVVEIIETTNPEKTISSTNVPQVVIVEISRPNTATTRLLNRSKLVEQLIRRPPRRIYNMSRETIVPLAVYG
ncbi:unnamed protein product [Didymodactylos carnosus]|uniref:Uncharacterized protein n=1 Tax=Didymodactylos carnosus TaxID=1234261 RepID=A0A816ALY6_9BILA|nr:unnamed protein product [Didymodactylos carnosus]CAF1598071.1 unnamed protein product [Didymodactylos carnosus]CAF4043434.1 unnamed protein product [Didymodactylos carnosus]CAF4473842.1 unnamed protein product [Didymodactylos carnosus]